MQQSKTSELSGKALDYAVAKCIKPEWLGNQAEVHVIQHGFNPSSNWAQGGPIIEREGISWHCGNKSNWHAYAYGSFDNFAGTTPLIAAMRCYVAAKLGESVDIPDELL